MADAARGFGRGIPSSASAELGSTRDWSRLYLRHGLGDLDRYGAAMMLMLLGHIIRRRRRAGARALDLEPYPFWAIVTAAVIRSTRRCIQTASLAAARPNGASAADDPELPSAGERRNRLTVAAAELKRDRNR